MDGRRVPHYGIKCFSIQNIRIFILTTSKWCSSYIIPLKSIFPQFGNPPWSWVQVDIPVGHCSEQFSFLHVGVFIAKINNPNSKRLNSVSSLLIWYSKYWNNDLSDKITTFRDLRPLGIHCNKCLENDHSEWWLLE